MEEACWICESTENLSQHHVCPRSYGGCNSPWNLVLLCGICHPAIHSRPHPNTLYDKVSRVKQGSSKHKRIKKTIDRLNRPECYDKIIRFRQVFILLDKGASHREAINICFPEQVGLNIWISPLAIKPIGS